MLLLKSYKWQFLTLFLLGVAFFAIRFYQLGALPIFTDEAIYLHWALVAKNDAAQRLISLTDGKQPMFVWLTVVALYGIKDPLFAGRLVSVFSGFFTMLGLFFFGKEVFQNKWVGILSAVIYLLYPMGLVYDRLAIYDSLVATYCVWSLYIEILLVKKVRLDMAFILALVLGGAMLTKTNAFFAVAFLPFSLVFFDWKGRKWRERFLNWFFYAGIAAALSYIYYSVLRLSPFFYIINQKNGEFVVPLRDLLHNPFQYFLGNAPAMANWTVTYLTIPFILVILFALFSGRKMIKEKGFLLLWFFIPFVYLAATAKIIYPRYLLFMTISLLPLAAYGIYQLYEIIKNRYVFVVIILGICSVAVWTDYNILTNIAYAPIPQGDKDQFVTGWSAGDGVKEAAAFFKKQAQNQKIYVGTEGTFGLMPYAFDTYLWKNPNIKIVSYWPVNDTPPKEILEAAKTMPTYFVFYEPCPSCSKAGIAPKTWPLREILRVEKIGDKSEFAVYQVLTQ